MSCESLKDGNNPRRPRLEQVNEVSLKVPHNDLAVELSRVESIGVPFVARLAALCELVGDWL